MPEKLGKEPVSQTPAALGRKHDFAWTPGTLALAALVIGYVAFLLIAPLFSLAARLAEAGFFSVLGELFKPQVTDSLGRTMLLTVIAAVVNGVAGVVLALVFTRQKFFGGGFLNSLLDLPFAMPPVMIGLSFILLFGRGGLLTPLLKLAGFKVVFSFPGLVLAVLFVTLPFTVREVSNVLGELGTGEEDAAATLGASRWQTFRWVTLPNIKNALNYGVMLTVARSLGEFGAVLVLGGAITGRTQTATTFIYKALEERWERAAYASSLVLIILSMALVLIIEYRKKITEGQNGHPR